ncbi:aminotransferase-like domain-containing protein [Telluria aromaticivorans]|uniref:PLP-dependent aminotransferase family protein n=1 Tax=Telluria aromaticivorans TaxID=2725995 RepID=A0A7Y2JV82_9BURK|nr:PLP-dependent aminotransferase family protein [Telluria aromaticivorans]NNG21645.1 PLP-dependent aminotransferase family protein [Telluria aromaticivorans]
MKRYEQLAEELASSIRTGLMKLGDRLPSVRQVSASRGVSASTVFEAYYLLEARGLIRARERSGYYVTAGGTSLPPEPGTACSYDATSLPVEVSELVFSVLASVTTREVVPLGSAFPSPLLFPLPRLARSLAYGANTMDPWSTVDDITPGNAALRRQIALRYLADGVHVQPDDIVITNGALEALNLSLQAVTKPCDCVIVESPTFYGALQALENLGLKAIEVPSSPRDGIDLGLLAQVLEMHRAAACWLMTNFQNPLGSLMPEEKKRALVSLLAAHEVPLIEDDVYAELYFGKKRPLPAKAFDQFGLVLHCSSFSKSLAPGYRLGWAIPGKFRQSVSRLKLMRTLAVAAPIQEGISDYLAKGGYDRHLRQLRHALSQQQISLATAVLRHFPFGTRATRPEGGYFMWVELPPGIDSLLLQRDASAAGISIAPGPMFSARASFKNCIRLNYGHPWTPEFDKAIATLGRLATIQLANAKMAPEAHVPALRRDDAIRRV